MSEYKLSAQDFHCIGKFMAHVDVNISIIAVCMVVIAAASVMM